MLGARGRPLAETSWNCEMGLEHEVSTPQRNNENAEDWRRRHANAVAALAEVAPPSRSNG